MFPPTQSEQPPQCVSNPESIVAELEEERLLVILPTQCEQLSQCVSDPELIVTELEEEKKITNVSAYTM